MQRLYFPYPLHEKAILPLSDEQYHYLIHVLRLKESAQLAVFNGKEGEWLACLKAQGKKKNFLKVERLLRPQTSEILPLYDVLYCFAPLKQARLDYLVQKAVELGVTKLCAVVTRYTQGKMIPVQRIQKNIIEAAEQCGTMLLPTFEHYPSLEALLTVWPAERRLLLCDEKGQHAPLLPFLLDLKPQQKIAVLIGPEGGFSDAERQVLRSCAFVQAMSLGPRILRAETATLAVLSTINAVANSHNYSEKGDTPL